MKRVSADKARDYFKERVNTCSKSLRDMADIVRSHPSVFKPQDIATMRAFMLAQVTALTDTMAQTVQTSVATEFDFGMPLPSVPSIAPQQTQPAAPAPASVGEILARHIAPPPPLPGGVRPKATGRLVGSKEVVIEHVPLVTRKIVDPDDNPDRTGYVDSGFLDTD